MAGTAGSIDWVTDMFGGLAAPRPPRTPRPVLRLVTSARPSVTLIGPADIERAWLEAMRENELSGRPVTLPPAS